jgi:hypothetical protein
VGKKKKTGCTGMRTTKVLMGWDRPPLHRQTEIIHVDFRPYSEPETAEVGTCRKRGNNAPHPDSQIMHSKDAEV